MSDIVERLCEGGWADWQTAEEAANEITRLRARVAELQEANDYLQGIVNDDGGEDARLSARVAELEEGLREIREHCGNEGRGNEIVDDRIIERCDRAAHALLTKAGESNG